jgi:hypothetical protein
MLDHSNHRFGQYDVESFEGTNCADEVLEMDFHATLSLWKIYQVRGLVVICATYAEWIPDVSVT